MSDIKLVGRILSGLNTRVQLSACAAGCSEMPGGASFFVSTTAKRIFLIGRVRTNAAKWVGREIMV
jgi:hypothetical protein